MILEEFDHEKQIIDQYLDQVSRQVTEQIAGEYGEKYVDVWSAFVAVLTRGGKRLRGVLASFAYRAFGGQDENTAREAAAIIELLHACLLVVDDVADQSDLRRGGPTAHRILEKYHNQHTLKGDAHHYGKSQAVNVGLTGQNLAFSRLADLKLDGEILVRAFKLLNDSLIKTGLGQIGDINNEVFASDSENDAMQVMQLKTAHYSFVMPFYFGATLAGAEIKNMQTFESYLVNIGIAFQIYDDVIGTFGDIDKTGKSNRDDIMEGKRTLLVVHALSHATPTSRQTIERALGNRQLADEEFVSAQDAIRDSGALDYCLNRAKNLILEGKKSLENNSVLSNTNRQMLLDVADYVASLPVSVQNDVQIH